MVYNDYIVEKVKETPPNTTAGVEGEFSCIRKFMFGENTKVSIGETDRVPICIYVSSGKTLVYQIFVAVRLGVIMFFLDNLPEKRV